ncbi:hypothetical protein LEP1GSC116_1837 [Leptospira interrogans serovar Icterohaemorrhagiae str. Verdun HP]|uniref:Uncharacterized protein n=1 Tax=Leptospira interrogans serovar Icterohaemorrhagiae str. Verdun HP TaxID=1049910 RepID=M6RNA2_LEPIR|nr:hypothetical protein LEP1GSC116_1837 [Leptospira interrogans serovar Icterohaemorrhagiae str. Verdun HP]
MEVWIEILPGFSINKKDFKILCKIKPAIPDINKIFELSGKKRFHLESVLVSVVNENCGCKNPANIPGMINSTIRI